VNHDAIVGSQPHWLVIPSSLMSLDDSLPTDLASAHALIFAQRRALSAAEHRAAAAESVLLPWNWHPERRAAA